MVTDLGGAKLIRMIHLQQRLPCNVIDCRALAEIVEHVHGKVESIGQESKLPLVVLETTSELYSMHHTCINDEPVFGMIFRWRIRPGCGFRRSHLFDEIAIKAYPHLVTIKITPFLVSCINQEPPSTGFASPALALLRFLFSFLFFRRLRFLSSALGGFRSVG